MLKHVMLPLDGSQLAEAALPYALNVLEPEGEITLVSAVEVPYVPAYVYFPGTLPEAYETQTEELIPYAKRYLEKQAEELEKQGFQVNIVIEIGEPAQVITEAAVKKHVEAIVMSTHGRSGLSRWLLGSVTQKVLSAKTCPVLVVPTRETGGEAARGVAAGREKERV
jgi:nucleotide-binding universal stress UspA family protein